MMVINVYSPKGGVGTTAVATLLALDYSKHHYIGLVAKDIEPNLATLGASSGPTPTIKYNHGLTISSGPIEGCDFMFVDSRAYMPAADLNILVLQNTYMSLRKCMHQKFDLAVAFMIENGALNYKDVCGVIKGINDGIEKPIQDMEWCSETLRKLDAGLCTSVLEREDWQRLVKTLDNVMTQDASF